MRIKLVKINCKLVAGIHASPQKSKNKQVLLVRRYAHIFASTRTISLYLPQMPLSAASVLHAFLLTLLLGATASVPPGDGDVNP